MNERAIRPLYVALGAVLCGLLTWGLWRAFSVFGFLFAAPAWGSLLALPLLEGAGAFGRFARWLAWRDVEGRYYAFRGTWMDVVEDAAGERHVRLAHVRRVLRDLPADASVARLYPDRVLARGRLAWLRDDALLEYLARSRAPEALALRRWVERDVRLPGVRRREFAAAAEAADAGPIGSDFAASPPEAADARPLRGERP